MTTSTGRSGQGVQTARGGDRKCALMSCVVYTAPAVKEACLAAPGKPLHA